MTTDLLNLVAMRICFYCVSPIWRVKRFGRFFLQIRFSPV